MAKTQEELTQLKEEYETLNNKIAELTDDELKLVSGGGSALERCKSALEPRTVEVD